MNTSGYDSGENSVENSSKGKGSHAKVVIVVVIIIVALGALAGLRLYDKYINPDVETADDTVNVTVAEAVLGDVQVTSVHTGKITAEDEVNVIPKIPGKVISVDVELGDKVSKGDILFRIDPSDVESQQSQAQIQRNAAAKGRSAAAGAVKDAKEARTDAKKSLKDVKKQIKDTEKMIEDAEKAGPAGAAMLAQAQSALQQLEQLKTQAELGVTQAQAGVKQAKSAYDQADAQYKLAGEGLSAAGDAIDETNVTAPISGYVTGLTVQKGGMVGQTMPAVVITGDGKIQVTTTVAENLVKDINVGDAAEVYVRAVSDDPLGGSIRQIVPAPPTGQTTYPVIVDIDNPTSELNPGMLTEVTMVTGRAEGVCLVPSDSIMIRNGKEIVAVLGAGDQVEVREVTTGIDDGDHVEIKDGVSAGERVVTQGQHYIDEDSKVRIAE
jgi:RND family efflux transporter MFP subunit